MTIVLHQFAHSHFNEKARWALDYKSVPHTRKFYLPGPHMPAIKKLSAQTQTPVLQDNNQIIAGSAAIISHLESSHPQVRLYPVDADERENALALQARFDQVVGPATRTAFFSVLINHLGYLCAMFAGSRPWLTRTAYRASLPLVKSLIAKGNGVDQADNVARAFAIVDETLTEVAQQTSATGHMVGNTFSVADLTTAALLAPLVQLQHPDMKRPQPVPQEISELYERYASHPASLWVQGIYQQFRG